MSRKIKVKFSKEDIFNVEDLIAEIKGDPGDAYALCEVYGSEGFDFDSFADFDFLTQEAKDRMIIELATSKAEIKAEFSYNQVEIFEPFPEFFEVED